MVGLVAVLAGCYSIGDRRISDESLIVKLEEGKGVLTREQVRQMLGRPMSITPGPSLFGVGQSETWIYMFMHSTMRPASFIPYVGLFAGGADTTSHTLTLQFDAVGTLSWVGKGEMWGGAGGIQDANRGPITQPTPVQEPAAYRPYPTESSIKNVPGGPGLRNQPVSPPSLTADQ